MRARSCYPSLSLPHSVFFSLSFSLFHCCLRCFSAASCRQMARSTFIFPSYIFTQNILLVYSGLSKCVCVCECAGVSAGIYCTHTKPFFHSAAAQTGVCFGSPCGLLVRELFVELCRVSPFFSSLYTLCFLSFPFHFLPASLLPSRLAHKVASQPHAARALNVARIVPAWCVCRISQTSSLSLSLSSFVIPLCTCLCPACARFGQNFCCFCLLWFLFLPHTLPARQPPLAPLFLPSSLSLYTL